MSQAPGKRRRRWLRLLLLFLSLYIIWAMVTPITWTSTTTEDFPYGTQIKRTSLHELRAHIGLEGVIIPLPYYHVLDQHELSVIADGKEWLQAKSDDRSVAHPSPDRRWIVLEHWLKNSPIRILHLETRQIITLNVTSPQDEFPGHYNGYPFNFIRWDTDESFVVEVTGYEWGPSVKYPQVWRVDARTGGRSRVE